MLCVFRLTCGDDAADCSGEGFLILFFFLNLFLLYSIKSKTPHLEQSFDLLDEVPKAVRTWTIFSTTSIQKNCSAPIRINMLECIECHMILSKFMQFLLFVALTIHSGLSNKQVCMCVLKKKWNHT